MDAMLAKLGDEIRDVDEETFDIFSEPAVSQDLGMVDPKASLLEVSVAGRDFKLSQSPGVLQSTRGGGTTGAAVWKSSILLAEWMAWPQNPLFDIGATESVLELGAGISGLVPLVVAPRASRVVATDQAYVMKALQANIAANAAAPVSKQKRKSGKASQDPKGPLNNIEAFALDWENDDISSVLCANGLRDGVDLIVACDCVYNYALIDPLVQTCADICKMRLREEDEYLPGQSTLCVIAQQLRQPDVFEQWLETFHRLFRVWRVPEDLLSAGLKAGSGFVVHVGILRH